MKNVIQGTTLSGTGAVSIAPRTEITIRNPAGQLVPLWADRAGTQPHDNPFLTDDEGNFRVYADSGWVHIRAQKDGSVREWRYVPLGSAAAMDIGEIYEALGSGIYSSVSEGLSNSAEGDYFLVESEGALDLYRVVNGVAEQRAAGIDDNAILATRAYADDVAAEAESNATNAAVAAASSAYQLATEYSDSQLQTHRGSDDHDHRYYTKTEVDQALSTKVDDSDPRLSDAREWTASTVSQAEAEAGTSTTRRAWTAQRVRQAIVAGYNALTSAFGRTLANASDATAARNTLGLGTAATRDVGTGANNVVVGSDPRLSDAREWTAEVVSQAEAEGGTSSVPRKWTAERVRQAIEALGGGGIDPGDLGTAATRDVTTSPTDTTAGRLLKVGDFGVGNTIVIPQGANLNDYTTPGEYFQTTNANAIPELNYPAPYAGSLKVIKSTVDGCVQEYTTHGDTRRKFLRGLYNGVWSSWVEFYHTGNIAKLISDANLYHTGNVAKLISDANLVQTSRTISTGTGLTGGGNLSANRTISLATSHIPIGVGQTWQDVTSQRAAGVNYTNTTGRTIFVAAGDDMSGLTSNLELVIGGKKISGFAVGGGSSISKNITVSGLVPPGSIYRINQLEIGSRITWWMELR